ncbi:MAG: hypothetical protein HC871_11510 [Rhizobiales bacterium]|nr:hypothetical protein [Hyphomicrobiales bacterium]
MNILSERYRKLERVYAQSSIKRLRLAFAAMAGLTLLALTVGCIAFAFSYSAQRRLLEEATPLLLRIERLSEAAVEFASASRLLESITSEGRLDRALIRYRTQSDRLQAELLELADHGSHAEIVAQLEDMVRELQAHKDSYLEILRTRIAAASRLVDLRRAIYAEGRVFQEQIERPLLDSSLMLVDAEAGAAHQGDARPELLGEALREVRLLTEISIAAERFLQAVGEDATVGAPAGPADPSEETLALSFRRLTELAPRLGNRESRQIVAASLKALEEQALGPEGLVDQAGMLTGSAGQLDRLNSERTILLTRMGDLVNEVVGNARHQFLGAAVRRSGKA